jgi:hypothetical protein
VKHLVFWRRVWFFGVGIGFVRSRQVGAANIGSHFVGIRQHDGNGGEADDDYLLDGNGVDVFAMIFFVFAMIPGLLSQIDGRSIRGPRQQQVTVRTNFWEVMKAQRSQTAFRKTLRCTPASLIMLDVVAVLRVVSV